jgi:hypothetical protein
MNSSSNTRSSAQSRAGVAAVFTRLSAVRWPTPDQPGGRLQHQVIASRIVVAHVGPSQAQPVQALCNQAGNVLDLAALPAIAQCAGNCSPQSQAGVRAPQQQQTTFGAQIATAEIRFDASMHRSLANRADRRPACLPCTLASVVGWHRGGADAFDNAPQREAADLDFRKDSGQSRKSLTMGETLPPSGAVQELPRLRATVVGSSSAKAHVAAEFRKPPRQL